MQTVSRNVAPGVHRLGLAYVNCYLVEGDDGLTLLDTGLPALWPLLQQALSDLGRTGRDLRAVVLTHAHFDHLGTAARLQSTLGVDVWAHPGDHFLAAHPYRYAPERPRLLYPVRYPQGAKILGSMARAGALRVRGVGSGLRAMADGETLDVPGRPRVVFTPGHTLGHCALHLPERDALVSGDALVTLDPYTGATGPQIVARAATENSQRALASLTALAETDAGVVLPGHGEPWTTGARAAVAEARHRPIR
ncbi:MAG: MBL fold metallo-hydrolase [Actinomycetes bacterium]